MYSVFLFFFLLISVDSMENETLPVWAKELKENVEKLRIQNQSAKQSMKSLATQIQRIDERSTKCHSDLAYTQQQLESVMISLEREHDLIADHVERLRLVANESMKNRSKNETHKSSTRFLVLFFRWLYTPAMHLAKGVYTLVSPLIYTFNSLSLFNSDILYRYSNASVEEELQTKEIRRENMLKMLQQGKLDPSSVSGR